jgi:hypothetical protein
MAENIYDVLLNNYPDLVGRVLSKQEEISKFLMLFYSHLLYVAAADNRKPEDLVCTVSIMSKDGRDLLHVSCSYKEGSDTTGSIKATRNPLHRNMTLARLLIVNTSVREVARSVVTTLERWVEEKPFRKEQGIFNVRLENGMFWKNLVCTAELVLKIEFDDLVKSKMKWQDDPDLAEADLSKREGEVIQ